MVTKYALVGKVLSLVALHVNTNEADLGESLKTRDTVDR